MKGLESSTFLKPKIVINILDTPEISELPKLTEMGMMSGGREVRVVSLNRRLNDEEIKNPEGHRINVLSKV